MTVDEISNLLNPSDDRMSDIARRFEEDADELESKYLLLASWDDSGSWETSYWGLLQEKATGKFFAISCSTCSCYGCEGQFDPDEVTAEQLKFRYDNCKPAVGDREQTLIKLLQAMESASGTGDWGVGS